MIKIDFKLFIQIELKWKIPNLHYVCYALN
jgi:hypothetical protein